MRVRQMCASVSWMFPGGHVMVQGQTLEKLAGVWTTWSEQDLPIRQAVSWADVKAHIVVKLVAARQMRVTCGECPKHDSC